MSEDNLNLLEIEKTQNDYDDYEEIYHSQDEENDFIEEETMNINILEEGEEDEMLQRDIINDEYFGYDNENSREGIINDDDNELIDEENPNILNESIADNNLTLDNPQNNSLSRKKERGNAKVVECYDLDGNLVEVFKSGMLAAIKMNVAQAEISLCCRGLKYQVGGYRFRFQDGYEEGNLSTIKLKKGFAYEPIPINNDAALNYSNIDASKLDSIRKKEKSNAKPVECYDFDGNVIEVFKSGLLASVKMNVAQGEISLCCRGLKYQVGGYRFRFQGDTEDKFAGIRMKKGFSTTNEDDNGEYREDRKRERNNAKAVECYDLDGNVIEVFRSGMLASIKMNITQGEISLCCRGLKYQVGGYRFRFHGDTEDKYLLVKSKKIQGMYDNDIADGNNNATSNTNKTEITRTTRRGSEKINNNSRNEKSKNSILASAELKVRKWHVDEVQIGSGIIIKRWIPDTNIPNQLLQDMLQYHKQHDDKKNKQQSRRRTITNRMSLTNANAALMKSYKYDD